MNWYWIDRFTVFESGKRAQAIKAITRAEEHLGDHFKFHSIMPISLVIEGLAQTAGLLVHETFGFKKKIVLGKIPNIRFSETDLVPGDVLIYDVNIEYIREDGSMVMVSVHRGEELLAEGTIIFGHLGSDFSDKALFDDGELEDLVRAYGMYDIGVTSEGAPLRDPLRVV